MYAENFYTMPTFANNENLKNAIDFNSVYYKLLPRSTLQYFVSYFVVLFSDILQDLNADIMR